MNISFPSGTLYLTANGESQILEIKDGSLTTRYSEEELKSLNEQDPNAQVPHRQQHFLNGIFSPREIAAKLNNRTKAFLVYETASGSQNLYLIIFGPFPGRGFLASLDKEANDLVAEMERELDKYFRRAVIGEDGRVYQHVIKVFVGNAKDFRIEIHPAGKEHNPPHFHATSVQRGINASFTLDGCELCGGDADKISGKDLRIIKSFYDQNLGLFAQMKDALGY